MADNYLEKRMDDYARGRLAKRTHATAAGGVPLMVKWVAVLGVHDADGVETIATLVGAGCRVVFTCSDDLDGQHIAQKTGARYYPGGTSQLYSDTALRGESMDRIVLFADMELPACLTPAGIAVNCSHPAFTRVQGRRPAMLIRALMTLPPLGEQTIQTPK